MIIIIASISTSATKLDSQKSKQKTEPANKATALILVIFLSRFKTHVLIKRSRYIVNTESDGEKKTSEQFTVCLKMCVGLGEKRKRIEKVLLKRSGIVRHSGAHL